MVDALAETFDLSPEYDSTFLGMHGPADVLVARAKNIGWSNMISEKTGYGVSERKVLLSFIPPSAGMFVWVKVHLHNHPKWDGKNAVDLENKLWIGAEFYYTYIVQSLLTCYDLVMR